MENICFIHNKTLPANEADPGYVTSLLQLLYEKYQVTKGNTRVSITIIEPGLSPEQCQRMQALVLELAHLDNLAFEFLDWIEYCTVFHNRYPGMPD